MNPLVSVVVPVYNSEEFLRQCLDSIADQTWKNLQILCVDDESSDNSWSILQEYAAKDPRFSVFRKTNEGVSKARNLALEHTSGEYIMFVDSDDWLDLDTVECAVQTAQEHTADVVMWSYIREMETEARKKYIFNGDMVFEAEDVKTRLYRRMIGLYGEEVAQPENMDALCPAWIKLYRSDLIRNNNIQFYDIREIGTYEDGLFNLDVFSHARKAVFIERYFYHYRRNNTASVTSVYKSQLPQQWDRLFKLLEQHIEENDLDYTFRKALSNRITLSMIGLGINEMESRDSSGNKIKKIRNLLTKPHYRKALKELELTCLPIHWKVFFMFVKMHWAMGVYGLLMVIQKIRGK